MSHSRSNHGNLRNSSNINKITNNKHFWSPIGTIVVPVEVKWFTSSLKGSFMLKKENHPCVRDIRPLIFKI